MDDVALARAVAQEAGALLLRLREVSGLTGSALGARGDRDADALIQARLRAERPGDFILSEETRDDSARCAARRVWIVDPLDGTREYADGSPEWAVHIGLAVDGRPAVGAVALPMTGRVFATDDAPPRLPSLPMPARMVVSRSRCPDLARRVGAALGAEMIGMGSAGVKAMAVVDGSADIYLHEGGQYEWDNCAPAAVAIAVGLHASRIDGSPLTYNCEDPLLPDLLICRPELAEAILALIGHARG